LLHFNVTAHPSSEWTAQQMVGAFAWDNAPRYLLHDRDSIYEGSLRQSNRLTVSNGFDRQLSPAEG
jgi:putative transposase